MENVIIKKNMEIDPDSEIIYSSSVAVGGDEEEVRLILFNKRLASTEEGIEMITESDTQIVMNRSTAAKLKDLLSEYLKED
ncbi:MAG: hypothetical protein Q4Q19_06680 [Methanobrevibacter sp.]|jgi:hypothetical protein|nr:hypothetical protein [Methanobrevibacter sp.]MDO5827927.1 hypothetical protein [Methanobrevibacter sp.]MEE0925126.1 hypothetical protein [Methanobrevibacter sp.]